MKFNICVILSTLFLLLSCDQVTINQSKKLDITIDRKYKNTFGILFDDILAGFYVVICLVLFMVGKTFFF